MANTQQSPKRTKVAHLVSLILLLGLALAGLRVVPVLWGVYSDRDAFDAGLGQIVANATIRQWPDRVIVQSVMRLASDKAFRLRQQDIEVKRPRGRPDVKLFVSYGRTAKFPGGYLHDFQFSSEVTGTSGL